jgi:hypothetical protein
MLGKITISPQEIHMGKQLTKQVFGVPSAEVIGMIDTSDKVQALRAAGYRYEARFGELELQFEAKASELRGAFLGEVAEINGDE